MTVKRGFTLIEILIVIVIIGITIGFALITFGDFGESKRISFAAEQLVNTLRLAQQQATIENSTLGLRIDNKSYQILKFQNNSQWQPISNKNVYKVHYLPPNTVILLKTNIKTSSNAPSIIINSLGELTPFVLSFGLNKENPVTIIKVNHNGDLSMEKLQ